jgi:hypothetical protein
LRWLASGRFLCCSGTPKRELSGTNPIVEIPAEHFPQTKQGGGH